MKILIFIFSLVVLVSQAEEVLTWNKAVDLAIQNNSDLQAAQANLRALKFTEKSLRSGYLPELSASLSGSQSGLLNEDTDPNENYTASLNLSQNLFSGFVTLERLNQAQANTRVSDANLQLTAARIAFELKSNFENLVFASQFIALTKDIVRRREDNLKMVTLRFESGRENKGSVLLSRANLSQAKFEVLQAENNRAVVKLQLDRSLGIDNEKPYGVVGEIPITAPPHIAPDFKSLATQTFDHKQVVAQAEASYAGFKIAQSGFYPSLNLSAASGRQDSIFFPRGDSSWSVALTLNIPIFNGGRDYYNTKSSSQNWMASEFNRSSVDRQLLVKLRQAYYTWVEAVEKLKVDESYRQAAVTRSEIAKSKYNNGLLSFDDWDQIENDLIARQKNYLQSYRDRVLAEAAWLQALGRGVRP